jgi:predicted transcriptional regulator
MRDKILYIEDEIEILTVLDIFGRVLPQGVRDELASVDEELRETGRAVNPARVKDIVGQSGTVQVEYRFPDALRAIQDDHEDFAIYIIDRNLGTSNYRDSELSLPPSVVFDPGKYENRQGDFLLNFLLGRLREDADRVYLHTANRTDQLRCRDDLAPILDLGVFSESHILDKSDEGKRQLRDIVKRATRISIRIENSATCRILESQLGDSALSQFYQVMENRESDDSEVIGNTLSALRNVLETMLKSLAEKKLAPQSIRDERGRLHYLYDTQGKLQISEMIKEWIKDNPDLLSNRMIVEFLFSIWGICSAFGSHNDPTDFPPTANTVISLSYALKEIVSWYDKVMA